MDTTEGGGELLSKARALAPMIRACRDETERTGRTPTDIVRALCDAGLFRMWLPKAVGGFEVDPVTFIDVVEELASADGAVAWNLMNGASYGLTAAYMAENTAREIWNTPHTVVAGQLPPMGRALAVEGGYRVSGGWSFGSGILHATWVLSGCAVFDGAQPRMSDAGAPAIVHVMTPVREVKIDTNSWHVSGLRGTGSCDYTMNDVLVPTERTFLFFYSHRFQPGPLYRLPPSLLAYPIAAVTIGIARAAIEALVELAKTSKSARGPLVEKPATQLAIAKADALVGAARAHLHQTARDLWSTVSAGARVTNLQRARARASVVFAPQLCAQAVDLVWKAAGAAAIRESTVIERCFRDLHAAAQHGAVVEGSAEDSGRVLLGLQPVNPTF